MKFNAAVEDLTFRLDNSKMSGNEVLQPIYIQRRFHLDTTSRSTGLAQQIELFGYHGDLEELDSKCLAVIYNELAE